ncbi:GNAT family N-acetyltransferase [Plantactinospora sp. S1510]|uniref:GNAT family N-acetyltransferase n=1 Tax=Plantactinospora alkalitolerans TaxID=2789879 RepID=A0ABS0GQW1_9ACTN|nr:GNAT family N-acetyltransferase [Plantactinospora alkalitolerans]
MRPSLTSRRLDLVAFVSDDVEELHEIFSDPQTHTIGGGPFRDIQQTRAWITRRLISHRDLGLCWYALRERSTQRLVGNCGVFAGRTGITEPEIGYEIRYDSQRRGYATEAATAVISECARAGLRRVWATVRPANTASLHVLNRTGMILDHHDEDEKGTLLYLSRVP